jgi:PadR family transcriptional regulator, regulatory protein PadR
MRNDTRSPRLGEVEQLVLLAVLRLGAPAYAVPIRELIRARGGVDLARGSIYVTLDRLERKGYLSSSLSEPLAEPGGKARRLFEVSPAGVAALRAARRAVERLSAGTVLEREA